MEKRNNKREEELFSYSNYENLATSLSSGALNLQHVYCIVGSGTASASELVINSLKGIDVEVTLIGNGNYFVDIISYGIFYWFHTYILTGSSFTY